MYVEPVRGMSATQKQQTVQMTTDTDNTIHAQSTEGEAEYNTSYDFTTPKTSASQTPTAAEMQSAETEKLKKAIERMNEQLPNSEAKFGIHEATNRVMIKLVDKDTQEVIKEIPPEKTLDMLAKSMEIAGVLLDQKL